MSILIELLIVAALAFAVRAALAQPWRGRAFGALKLWLTVRAVWLLSVWPVAQPDGTREPLYQVVWSTASAIDRSRTTSAPSLRFNTGRTWRQPTDA